MRGDTKFLTVAVDVSTADRRGLAAMGTEALHYVSVASASRHLAVTTLVDRLPDDARSATPASGPSEIGREFPPPYQPRDPLLFFLDGAAVDDPHRGQR